MSNIIFRFPSFPRRSTGWVGVILAGSSLPALVVHAGPAAPVVPGYVAPVAQTSVAPYIDDTRGVYVPEHEQLRGKTAAELADWSNVMPAAGGQSAQGGEQTLNRLASEVGDTNSELERIGSEPGLLENGGRPFNNVQMAQATTQRRSGAAADDLSSYPSLATGGKAARPMDIGASPMQPAPTMQGADGGIELAVGGTAGNEQLDLQHAVVKLKEERISVRRALQRMLDQVGGNSWSVVWDLDEVNAGLPDMEISIYAEEPFVKVLNALLARLQTRSGQPLRVIKYDKTQRLVITDRTGGDARSSSIGAGQVAGGADVAVTESVLKEAKVSLHYDEVPLVDALENIVNQAGKGQWRLRMYAGTDQVLKPAHVEEPFGVAIERILKIFNLRYEMFPGGKLIVVTGGDRFGFKGVE